MRKGNAGMIKGATLSADYRYRYRLWRDWRGTPASGRGTTVLWVMLNPSTANAEEDDPTIRRCLAFTRREGFGRMDVVNLFALRATDPAQLRTASDPIGPAWEGATRAALQGADAILCAWGAHGSYRGRDVEVLRFLQAERPPGAPIWCLGSTKLGLPRHPLYLAAGTPLQHYP